MVFCSEHCTSYKLGWKRRKKWEIDCSENGSDEYSVLTQCRRSIFRNIRTIKEKIPVTRRIVWINTFYGN